jgi:hypothetical protein
MIVAMEELFDGKERSNATYFPRYYFVLGPFGDDQMNGLSLGSQCSGMENLKNDIRELRDCHEKGRLHQEREILFMKKEISDQLVFMEGRMMESMKKINERAEVLEERYGAMEEHLLTILTEINR